MHIIIIGLYSFLTLAAVYFIIRNGKSYILYSVVFFFVLLSVLGSLGKILHLPGADMLLMAVLFGSLAGAVLLVWHALRNRQGQLLLYKLMAGVIILIQLVAAWMWPEHNAKTALLNYPLTAFLWTILINKQYEHEGEKNLVLLFLFQGLVYIIIDATQLL